MHTTGEIRMVQKVFWVNPYQTELLAKITEKDGHQVQLDKTIFYAESGGQESDSGSIGGINVIQAEKKGVDIIYTLEELPHFGIDDEVEVCIDWERRYQLMKLHFAAEVVLELFYAQCKDINKIGAHISSNKSRIDFEWTESINTVLKEIETKAQAISDADLVIESKFSDHTNEKRYWHVEGVAQVPCGGTHLVKTSEMGIIKLKRKNLGKGKERVDIYVA
jgi:alanyl-tRNA synthetase